MRVFVVSISDAKHQHPFGHRQPGEVDRAFSGGFRNCEAWYPVPCLLRESVPRTRQDGFWPCSGVVVRPLGGADILLMFRSGPMQPMQATAVEGQHDQAPLSLCLLDAAQQELPETLRPLVDLELWFHCLLTWSGTGAVHRLRQPFAHG